jgi:DNA-binding beta-propeller fold protein YncE
MRTLVGRTRCRVREGPARVARIAFAVCAVTLTLGAATAHASFLSQISSFGTPGSGAGQFQTPVGVAIQQTSGNVFVADAGNARVEKFDAQGNFLAAFGWGVRDGKAQSEVCTRNCQAGIPGSGPGQFSSPTSIATAPSGKVYVGDAGNNVVLKFDTDGSFNSTIDGTTTPQGHFQSLAGISVDQNGNLWTADASTNNIDEFNAKGAFVRQWTDTHGPPSAIAVDSANGAVYVMISFPSAPGLLVSSFPITERWTLTGQPQGEIDRPIVFGSATGFDGAATGSALALDPATGNLYVDHNGSSHADVAVYDRNGVQVDDLSLPSTSNSEGLAFRPSGPGNPASDLYLSDASASNVTIYAPQTAAGAPLVNSESATQTGRTTATLAAGIVPLGNDTTCTFQFVDNADFQASGYSNATSVACTPADLGAGFTYQAPSADLSGLTTGTIYHFRVVATSSAGTSTGADQEFQAGPGAWASFFRCPVDDPAMLATNGDFSTLGLALCLGSNSTHGSITLGNITTTTGNTNLQTGLVDTNGTFTVIPGGSPAGSLIADPVELSTPVGPVTAITESAGAPSNFNLIAGISTGTPIITVPIKIHLANNPTLGPSCFIGSEQDPILLNPQNNDLSNALSVGGFFSFDAANGAPDVTGPDGALLITGLVQGDDTFAVPGATGCGPGGSLDAVVDAVAGLPSPSGSNHLVLDDASSSLAFPQNSENGQAFANDWHVAFGP